MHEIKKILDDSILFEDDFLTIINKPPGVVVNLADTVQNDTIQSWWWQRCSQNAPKKEWLSRIPEDFNTEYGTPAEIFEQRQGIVHRLDKDTSGCLVLAKDPATLVSLLSSFKERQIDKTYLTLVHGKVEPEVGQITAPLKRHPVRRQLFAVDATGRPAQTEYKVQKVFVGIDLAHFERLRGAALPGQAKHKLESYAGFSLVECSPKTGRTHQLRVHWSFVGHPIVGDEKYNGRKRAKLDAAWCPRQFLHAAQLSFAHPVFGRTVARSAPLSADLVAVLALLSVDDEE